MRDRAGPGKRSTARRALALLVAATLASCGDGDGRSPGAKTREQSGEAEGSDFTYGEPCTVSVVASGSVHGSLADQRSLLCSGELRSGRFGVTFATTPHPAGHAPDAIGAFYVQIPDAVLAKGEAGEFAAAVQAMAGSQQVYASEDCTIRLEQTAVPEVIDENTSPYVFSREPYRVTAEGSCRSPLRPYDPLAQAFLPDRSEELHITPFSFSVVAAWYK